MSKTHKTKNVPLPCGHWPPLPVTLAILFVLLLAAYALPGERVRQHVYDSARDDRKTRGCTRNIWASSSSRWTTTPTRLMLFEAAQRRRGCRP